MTFELDPTKYLALEMKALQNVAAACLSTLKLCYSLFYNVRCCETVLFSLLENMPCAFPSLPCACDIHPCPLHSSSPKSTSSLRLILICVVDDEWSLSSDLTSKYLLYSPKALTFCSISQLSTHISYISLEWEHESGSKFCILSQPLSISI